MSSPPPKRTKTCAQRDRPPTSRRPSRPLRIPRADPPPQAASSSAGAKDLHPLLQFTNKRTQVKVSALKSLPIEPNRYLSQSDLEKLGL